MQKLETYIGFEPDKVADYFLGRNWPVNLVPVDRVSLVKVTRGAALRCGDGRFDQLEGSEGIYGVRVFGGINAIMALHTGGDVVGLDRATDLIKKRFGLTPGTHGADQGGCGFADLWMNGELKSAHYPYELSSEIDKGGLRIGMWLGKRMADLGGKHFRLNGNHNEKGVRMNPFKRVTEVAKDGLRFRVDDWFMAELGIPDQVRFFKIAEAVEKLKPDAAKLEIIVP